MQQQEHSSMGLLTRDQIVVVKNDLEEKGWSSYHIWKGHPTFNCSKNTINLVNKIKKTGSGDRKKGSGGKIMTATSENEELVEELICSQEEHLGTHYSIRELLQHCLFLKLPFTIWSKEKGFM